MSCSSSSHLHVLYAAMTLALAGCSGDDAASNDAGSGTSGPTSSDTDAPTGMVADSGSEGVGGSEESVGTEEPPAGPHALGTIMLGEFHAASGGTATPVVSASFIPDAALVTAACTVEVAGCQITVAPDCGEAGCDPDQFCGFDEGCGSACVDFCDAECGPDEICYFPSPGNAACRAVETFDAGVLTFSGTTTALTLFPPYTFDGEASGAPFAPGAALSVQASGATDAGYAAFEASFTATDLVQTNLTDIGIVDAYGDGPVPISWNASGESITINASVVGLEGSAGFITCEADDAAGAFDFPRAAIDAAIDDQALANISLTVTRRRTERITGLETTGELLDATVQEDGWLELVTSSAESFAIEGCGFGEAVCGDECVDVSSDPNNCGGCGAACGASDQCVNSTCSGPNACEACIGGNPPECADENNTCMSNPDCVALNNCVGACNGDQTCVNNCVEMNPDGLSDLQNFFQCLCLEGCSTECAGQC